MLRLYFQFAVRAVIGQQPFAQYVPPDQTGVEGLPNYRTGYDPHNVESRQFSLREGDCGGVGRERSLASTNSCDPAPVSVEKSAGRSDLWIDYSQGSASINQRFNGELWILKPDSSSFFHFRPTDTDYDLDDRSLQLQYVRVRAPLQIMPLVDEVDRLLCPNLLYKEIPAETCYFKTSFECGFEIRMETDYSSSSDHHKFTGMQPQPLRLMLLEDSEFFLQRFFVRGHGTSPQILIGITIYRYL